MIFKLQFSSAIVVIALLISNIPAMAYDINLLREQLSSELVIIDGDTPESTLQFWISDQNEDGSWPGVDYADPNRSGWDPYFSHVIKVRSMAGAYANANHPMVGDSDLLNAILTGIDYWIATRPESLGSSNWWFRDIGVPNRFGETAAILYQELSDEQKSGIIDLIPESASRTGQNRVWTSEGVILRGLLENSVSRIRSGYYGISSTINETVNEGIQHDTSFHQHGNQFQSGGYGRPFITDIALYSCASRNTDFGISDGKLSLMRRVALEGLGWMVRGDTIDYSTIGRSITRQNYTTKALEVAYAVDALSKVDSGHAADYQALFDHINGDLAAGPMGSRYYWRSDFLVQRTPQALISVRMASDRVEVPEEANNENVLGRFLGFGCQLIYLSGDEYDDLFPVWDWRKIPGTTVAQNGNPPTRDYREPGPDSFVGGISDGEFGLATMDHSFEGVSAKKSWFFFDGGFVALGTGINSSEGAAVWTTINQTRLNSNTLIDGNELSSGERTTSSPNWVHHDNVGYVFLEPSQVFSRNASQDGNWHDINERYPDEIISDDVFLLAIDHGTSPDKESYAYAVLPGVNSSEAQAFSAAPDIQILSNTEAVQAISDGKRTSIVFFEPGTLDTNLGMSVTVDRPCAIMLQLNEDDLKISTADPKSEDSTVNVSISGKLEGEGVSFIPSTAVSSTSWNFTSGRHGGRTESKTFKWSAAEPNGKPSAVAKASKALADVGEAITFDGSDSVSGDNLIQSYEWNFDDGETSTGQSVEHSFDATGTYRVRLKVTDEAGRTDISTITITVGILPEADSYVRGDTFQNDNYGSEIILAVKDDSGTNIDRQSFLRFSLNDLKADTGQVLLTLTVTALGGEDVTNRQVRLLQVADDTWTESGITWATKPAVGETIKNFTVSENDKFKQIEIDVTDYIEAAVDANGIASFAIIQPNNNKAFVGFGSRESDNPPFLRTKMDYSDWQGRWFPGDTSAPSDDFDGDGWENLLEYGLGGNPRSNEDKRWGVRALSMSNIQRDLDGNLSLVYEVNWMAADIEPIFECSNDLVQWETVGEEQMSEVGTLHLLTSVMDADYKFYRLRAEAM